MTENPPHGVHGWRRQRSAQHVRQMSHEEAVEQMMQDRSEVVRGIAAHHTAELGRRPTQGTAQEVQSLA